MTHGQEPTSAELKTQLAAANQALEEAKKAAEDGKAAGARLSVLEKELAEARREAANYRTKTGAKTAEERVEALEAELVEAKKVGERVSVIEKDLADARATATRAERRASLYPIFKDDARVTAALMMAEQNNLIGDDGKVQTDKLLTDFPFLRPDAGSPSIANVNPSNDLPLSMESAVKSGDPAAINATFDAALRRSR